jgi:c(7)-type cytochrome triheme protein
MKKTCSLVLVLFLALLCAGLVQAKDGIKKKRVRPHLYGRVIIDNNSSSIGLAPVVFDHWLHRANATCRVCHVDIGFAMEANGTEITASDNIRGFFCGTCHNGKVMYDGKPLFSACSEESPSLAIEECQRCHNNGDTPDLEEKFYNFSAKLPKERQGNGINWEQAEAKGHITPTDYIEGISVEGMDLAVVDDFSITSKIEGMPDIIFSHTKHTVWNGCEVCHPDIFMGVRQGATTYSMIDLFQGKYCGVCHDTVAFPQSGCKRCHTKL